MRYDTYEKKMYLDLFPVPFHLYKRYGRRGSVEKIDMLISIGRWMYDGEKVYK